MTSKTAVRSRYLHDSRHGPLPALLLVLTVATGVVDAVSIIALGRVFVANMTGNVVFIGFALARAPGFSLDASAVALAGFLLGAALGGALGQHRGGHRGRLLRDGAALEFVLLAGATVLTAVVGSPPAQGPRDAAVALAALALGAQNAVVRRLGVPDLTTTVLTMTLTGIAADLRTGNVPVAVGRVLAVVTMLGGAVVGALLVLHVDVATGLGAAAGLVGLVCLAASTTARRADGWTSP